MEEFIEDFVPRAGLRDPTDRWWVNTKISDDFLDRVFACFFKKLSLPNLMRKTDYHVLADFISGDQIDAEVVTLLDSMGNVAGRARTPPHDKTGDREGSHFLPPLAGSLS